MSDSPAEGQRTEPPTEIGIHADTQDEQVRLPDGALDDGCYVEGPESHRQTALVHSWCVQWAEAGYGFMYVHPQGPDPHELLARLPDDRLDDVVWIDVNRRRISPVLDVPPLRRVTVDPFDIPDRDHEALTVDPVNTRTSAYMDAFSEQSAFDWRVAHVLSAVLPARFIRDDVGISDVNSAVEVDSLVELCASQASPDSNAGQELAIIKRAMHGIFDREGSAARDAGELIRLLYEAYTQNPFMDDTSYDIGDALSEGHIVLVTGNWATEGAQLRTRLLVAALCCRLIEAATISGVDGPTFPVVFNRIGELYAGEGDLEQRLMRLSDRLPIAPVFSGPPKDHLEQSLRDFVNIEFDTRVVVADPHAHRPDSRFDGERLNLSSSLITWELEAVERYLQREASGTVAEGPLCWLRTGCTNRLVGADGVDQSMEPALAPDPPEKRHSPEAVAEAITRSLERRGVEPLGWSEHFLDKAREEFRNRGSDAY